MPLLSRRLALLLVLLMGVRAYAQEAPSSDWRAMEDRFAATVDEDQSGASKTLALLEKFLEARKDAPHRPHTAEEDARFREVGALRKAAGQAHLRITMPLLRQCGWPDDTQLSEKASRAAWLTLQQATKEEQDLASPLIEEAFKAGRLRPSEYALLVDRIRSRNQLPQRYGSQVFTKLSPSFPTNSWGPVEDPDHLDERRTAIGLETICDDLRGFGDLDVDALNPRCAKR